MKTKSVKKMFALLSAMLFSLTFVVVAQDPELYPDRPLKPGEKLETAKVIDVIEHPEGRPFDYVHESSLVPIYDGYPFYEITFQVGNKTYLVRYENMGGYYPTAWKPGNEVKVKIDDGRAYILRYDGVLVNTPIISS